MKVGDKVRIVRDEHPHLVGKVGTLVRFAPDGTTAWVESPALGIGVWCSVALLAVEEEES